MCMWPNTRFNNTLVCRSQARNQVHSIRRSGGNAATTGAPSVADATVSCRMPHTLTALSHICVCVVLLMTVLLVLLPTLLLLVLYQANEVVYAQSGHMYHVPMSTTTTTTGDECVSLFWSGVHYSPRSQPTHTHVPIAHHALASACSGSACRVRARLLAPVCIYRCWYSAWNILLGKMD